MNGKDNSRGRASQSTQRLLKSGCKLCGVCDLVGWPVTEADATSAEADDKEMKNILRLKDIIFSRPRA
jgi:hypothetical protein